VCTMWIDAQTCNMQQPLHWLHPAPSSPPWLLHLQAYQAAQYVHKGAQIAVGGRLQQDEWTNTRGEREYMIKVA